MQQLMQPLLEQKVKFLGYFLCFLTKNLSLHYDFIGAIESGCNCDGAKKWLF